MYSMHTQYIAVQHIPNGPNLPVVMVPSGLVVVVPYGKPWDALGRANAIPAPLVQFITPAVHGCTAHSNGQTHLW
jgi:hypothetical protein